MKSLIVLAIASLSSLAVASGLEQGHAYIQEVKTTHAAQGDEVTHRTIMFTNLVTSNDTKLAYRLEATSPTTWQQGAQYINIQTVLLTYAPGGLSKMTIYQTDGNSMGATSSTVDMSCSSSDHSLICVAPIEDGNELYLVIAR